MVGENPPDSTNFLSVKYDEKSNRLVSYTHDVRYGDVGFIFIFCICHVQEIVELNADSFNNIYDLPVIRTIDIQSHLDSFLPWLDSKHRQPFLVVGPDGCGKG